MALPRSPDTSSAASSPSASTSGLPSSPGAGVPPTTSRPPSTTSPPPAECRRDGSRVSCDVAHTEESIRGVTCDPAGILAYAGGDTALDSVAPGLAVRAVDDRCEVTWVTPLTGPLAGALGRPDGAALRTCLSDRSGTRFVPCTQRHDLELVSGVQDVRPSDAECLALAERHLAAPATSWQRSVTTTILREGSTYRCAVGPTGDDQLVGSLRRNGTNAIRLQQPSAPSREPAWDHGV